MPASIPPPTTFGNAATFSGIRVRLVGMAADAATDEHRFRFAKSLIAVAAARYQRLAERSTPGFDARVAPDIPNHMPAWPIPVNLGLPSVPDSEADDNWWHWTWIGILRLLSSQFPKAGLPGTSTVGGGYMQPLGRDDEFAIDDVYFSGATWRQLVDDSTIACGLLAALDPEDIEYAPRTRGPRVNDHPGVNPAQEQALSHPVLTGPRVNSTTASTATHARQSAQPSIAYMAAAKFMGNPPKGASWGAFGCDESTLRKWADEWRRGEGRESQDGLGLSEVEGMSLWLRGTKKHKRDVAIPALIALAQHLRSQQTGK